MAEWHGYSSKMLLLLAVMDTECALVVNVCTADSNRTNDSE